MVNRNRSDFRYRVRVGRGKVVHAARDSIRYNPDWRGCICGYDGVAGYDCTVLPPETVVTCKECLRLLALL